MLRSTFPGKRLPSAGRPCKFDHNVIIRDYVYACVAHATEIHLHSLIGASTSMGVHVFRNSIEGISKLSAEKIYMRIA